MKTPYLDNLIRKLDPNNFKDFNLKKRERIAKERAEYIAIKKALGLSYVSVSVLDFAIWLEQQPSHIQMHNPRHQTILYIESKTEL